MRPSRFLAGILAFALCVGTALGAYTEVYVTKAGADTNGGTGEGAAKVSKTDVKATLTVGAGAAGSTYNLELEGADNGTGWGTAAVGDGLQWDTDGAKEFGRISALAVGGDSDIIAVISWSATFGTNSPNEPVSVGGAWLTVKWPASLLTTAFVNAAGDPPRINVGPGVYAEYAEMTTDATYAIPITLEGYYATAGDQCDNAGTWTPPTINGTGSSVAALYVNGADYRRVRHFIITSSVNDNAVRSTGFYCRFAHLKCSTTTAGTADAVNVVGAGTVIEDVYVSGSRGIGINLSSSASDYVTVIGCVVADTAGFGYHATSAGDGSVFFGCIADSCGDDGFRIESISSRTVMISCVSYNSTAGSGLRVRDGTTHHPVQVVNCIFAENSQYGIEIDAVTPLYLKDNAYFGNGVDIGGPGAGYEWSNVWVAGASAHLVAHAPEDISLSGDPFVGAGAGIFTLDATAAEGAACRGVGFPGAMLDGVNVGHLDIGALQHEDPGGGSGIYRIRPRIHGD